MPFLFLISIIIHYREQLPFNIQHEHAYVWQTIRLYWQQAICGFNGEESLDMCTVVKNSCRGSCWRHASRDGDTASQRRQVLNVLPLACRWSLRRTDSRDWRVTAWRATAGCDVHAARHGHCARSPGQTRQHHRQPRVALQVSRARRTTELSLVIVLNVNKQLPSYSLVIC